MAISPMYIQDFINKKQNLHSTEIVESYYRYITIVGIADSYDLFKCYAHGWADGSLWGMMQPIKDD